MRVLYLISVWLHILAAITWIGGMFFLVLVVVPWLRRGDRVQAGAFLRETGVRFRGVGWTCFGILIGTGTFNLWARGVRLADFTRSEWLSSPFGRTVMLKLSVFLAVVIVSAVHDFGIGPQAAREIEANQGSSRAAVLRKRASALGRLNVLLSLALVALGVILVRGWP